MVPLVPTGMYTGVKTSPWGKVMVMALANPYSASIRHFSGFYYVFSFFLVYPKWSKLSSITFFSVVNLQNLCIVVNLIIIIFKETKIKEILWQ